MLENIQKALQNLANPTQAKNLQRFFKTSLGQYGEGDIFLGLKVPQIRQIVSKYYKGTTLAEIKNLLLSDFHEARLTGFLILVKQYESTKDWQLKKELVNFYLANLERANNWDLVDLSAPKILGDYLLHQSKEERKVLYKLAISTNLWRQRVAILATFAFIKDDELDDAINISLLLLSHPHDLIHKAVGWMLRELGKKDQKLLEEFLKENYRKISRTTLRYSIEKFAESKRLTYLKGEF